jgi:hypothetical protein
MRTFTILFAALALSATVATAQTVSTFDTLHLAHADTFYVNYSASGSDVGFNDGLAHFPCVYDTSYGGFWSYGFAYSNMTDSVTGGVGNQYSARTGSGYGGSHNYAVAFCFDPITYQNTVKINLLGAARGRTVSGFYVTNSTYAYNSIKYGDMFTHRFSNGDWFKLTVRGYSGGVLQPDSVGIYLANFLFPDTTMNYILKTWEWVNLSTLGHVDSLQFALTSSDNGMYGMNTPAYFCIDNFTTNEAALSATNMPAATIAKVYPNPVTSTLYVDVADNTVDKIMVMNLAGNILQTYAADKKQVAINTSSFAAGVYMLQLVGNGKVSTVRFVKE